jgi:translation elongation factor P/translation initiation factor 5A
MNIENIHLQKGMIIALQGHVCKITNKTVTKFGSRNKYALPKVIIVGIDVETNKKYTDILFSTHFTTIIDCASNLRL